MDRIALAKRLEGLSKVFASTTPYHRDLKAMAEVLTRVEDEKFATILSPDFTAEAAAEVDAAYQRGQNLPGLSQGMRTTPSTGTTPLADPQIALKALKSNPRATIDDALALIRKYPELKSTPISDLKGVVEPMHTPAPVPAVAPVRMASEENTGMFWSKEASEAVQNNLVRDVVGMEKSICCDTKRHLDKGQVPDGSHDGEKAATLKKEQTPDQSKSLDSGIVEKSHGKVNKEAGSVKGPGVPDGTGPCSKTDKCQMNKDDDKDACDDKAKKEAAAAAESAAAKAKKKKDDEAAAKKAKETAKAVEDLKKDKDATVVPVTEEKDATFEDSFELGDAMDEITLDAAEQDKLSQLFA